MCFSVEADLASGVAVGVVGIDTLRHVTRPAHLPLAALPAVFAAHQLNEAFVWWGLEGSLSPATARAAAWVYLTVAFVLPTLVPVAVALIEREPTRRRVMWVLAALGAVVSSVLLGALVRGGPSARLADHHIAYSVDLTYGGVWAVAYVVVTCGAFLASSEQRMATVGALNLLAVSVLAWFLMTGVISLWCAWAALVSLLIAVWFRSQARTNSSCSSSTPWSSAETTTGAEGTSTS